MGVVVALAVGEAVDDAEALAVGDEPRAMNAAKVAAIGCPWWVEALAVVAGRLAHVVTAVRATSR